MSCSTFQTKHMLALFKTVGVQDYVLIHDLYLVTFKQVDFEISWGKTRLEINSRILSLQIIQFQ